MSTVLLLLATVWAAPPGYKQLTTGNDCIVYRGPALADGTSPVQAECNWPDVDPAKLHAQLSDWANHANIFSTVLVSKVEKTEGNRALVYQEHALSGVSNREMRAWFEKKPVDGGYEYAWKSVEPVTPKKGNVAALRNEGFWRVTAQPGGGARVVYRLAYNPGGSVPGFLVRWFQGSGTIDSTEQVRAVGR